MKLYFINHSCLFAVEQMMMTLFPGERPVYPEEPPEPEDLAATVSVLYGMKEVTADTLLQKDGVMYRGRRQGACRGVLRPADEQEGPSAHRPSVLL